MAATLGFLDSVVWNVFGSIYREMARGFSTRKLTDPSCSRFAHREVLPNQRVKLAARATLRCGAVFTSHARGPQLTRGPLGGSRRSKEQALDWLEKAYEERNWYLVFINVDPTFDPLRDNPRFQSFLPRMNFPE